MKFPYLKKISKKSLNFKNELLNILVIFSRWIIYCLINICNNIFGIFFFYRFLFFNQMQFSNNKTIVSTYYFLQKLIKNLKLRK